MQRQFLDVLAKTRKEEVKQVILIPQVRFLTRRDGTRLRTAPLAKAALHRMLNQ